MVAVELPVEAPHCLAIAFRHLTVTMKNVIAHVDGAIEHLPGLLQQGVEGGKSVGIRLPAIALIQPAIQQLRHAKVAAIAG